MPVRLSFVLPLPTSTNRLHVGSGPGKRRTVHYAAWLNEAGWRINELRPGWPVRGLPANRLYRARLRWPVDDPADADNRVKALFDLLARMRVTPDDRWLYGYSAGRSPLVADGCCSVSVWSIEDRWE